MNEIINVNGCNRSASELTVAIARLPGCRRESLSVTLV